MLSLFVFWKVVKFWCGITLELNVVEYWVRYQLKDNLIENICWEFQNSIILGYGFIRKKVIGWNFCWKVIVFWKNATYLININIILVRKILLDNILTKVSFKMLGEILGLFLCPQ